MGSQSILNIRDFAPGDPAQVHELFANGLMEFAGEHKDRVRSYVNHALRDDLADIPTHYMSHDRGNFWVVESGGSIVGIVGIQPTGKEEEAELRRMSVSSLVRRQGIGRMLLATTDEFCREKGYSRIGLSTGDILRPALAMYGKNGYTTLKVEPYGEPPGKPLTIHFLVKELYQSG